MTRLRTALPPAVALGLAIAFLIPTGRAQEAPAARFAFADTTLLRDTLGLRFDRLFHLADSLEVPAARLRALAIRYRMAVERFVFLSDSLRLPVDSVGAVMERERFNPLALQVQSLSAFSYNSGYQVTQQGRASWGNGTEYQFSRGGIRARNVTNVSIDRIRGKLSTLSRVSETEANLLVSRNFSVGGRVYLQRDQSFEVEQASVLNNNEYQLTLRSSHRPRRSLRTALNLFLGPFDEPEGPGVPGKRGVSGQVSGSAAYNHRGWLAYDLDGRLDTRVGRGRLAARPWLGLREMFGSARGVLSVYERTPVSLRFTHEIRRNRAETPDTLSVFGAQGPESTYFLRRLPSGSTALALAMNLRRGTQGTMTVTGELRNGERLLKLGGINRSSTSHSASLQATGRATVRGWTVDARLGVSKPVADDPLRVTRTLDTSVVALEYRQETETFTRNFDVSADRMLTPKLSVRGKARIYLSSPRAVISDSSYRDRPDVNGRIRLFPTEPRDTYEDGVELQGIYTSSERFSTSMLLEIATRDHINLMSASSSRNTHVRTYRGQWSWTYRLMRGLTATQRNQVSADYTYFPFAPAQNALSMRFDIRTTLNALVSPRFRIDLTHVSEEQPRGTYIPDETGTSYFRVGTRSRAYQLSTNLAYTPIPALSFTLAPTYRADAGGTVGGALFKSLNMSGGATVNLPVSSRGHLTGNMARTYLVQSGTAGQPSRGDYSWAGSLQLSWRIE